LAREAFPIVLGEQRPLKSWSSAIEGQPSVLDLCWPTGKGYPWVPAFPGMTSDRIVVILIVLPRGIVIPHFIVIPAKAGTQELDSLQQLHGTLARLALTAADFSALSTS
jgi:hypothetical protein